VKRSALLFTAALVVFLAGCGGDDGDGESFAATTAAEATVTEAAEESDRCMRVPRGLVEAIETGLTVEGGGRLMNARAVKSNDFKRVYFISADIEGPGLEGPNPDEIGTWSKSGPLRVGDGLIYAVDATANEFSDWGDGRKTDAELSMEDDGAEESKDCVEDAAR
jgi:hypothetical protein